MQIQVSGEFTEDRPATVAAVNYNHVVSTVYTVNVQDMKYLNNTMVGYRQKNMKDSNPPHPPMPPLVVMVINGVTVGYKRCD